MAPKTGENAKSKKDDLNVVEPLRNDILLGRGKHAEDQQGNIYFRSVTQRWAVAYQETDSIMARNDIALKAMAELEAEGCRFLQLQKIPALKAVSENTQRWVIIPRKAALSKVKQALRDGTRQLLASRRAVSLIRTDWSSSSFRNRSLEEPPTASAGTSNKQSLAPPSRWSSSAAMGHNAKHFTVGIGGNPILAPDDSSRAPAVDGSLLLAPFNYSRNEHVMRSGAEATIPVEAYARLPEDLDKSDAQGLESRASSLWRIAATNNQSMHAHFNTAVNTAASAHCSRHVQDPCQYGRAVTVKTVGATGQREQRYAQCIRPKLSQEAKAVDEMGALLAPAVVGDLQGNWFASTTTPVNSPESQQRWSPSFLENLFEDED